MTSKENKLADVWIDVNTKNVVPYRSAHISQTTLPQVSSTLALKETWDEPQEWFLQLFSVKPVGVPYLFYIQIPKLDYNISCKDIEMSNTNISEIHYKVLF